ncbi:MAG TPA: AMP-binding protein, partial [Caldilineae bacterium]|nr:AMP-binding protein [Caldilineae bacterium]
MDRKNIETFYPLTPMQQGMLFHTLYEPESGVYVELLTAAWHGDVDIDAFRRTWQRVVDRHEALRTAFLWEGLKEPIQVVQRQAEVTVTELGWRTATPEEQQERLDEYLREERKRGFDLTKAPLLRLSLIRMADEEYRLVWTHHHLLMDGWSIPLLLKEVFAFYAAYLRGEELQLPKPRPYRDYIVWLKRQDMEAAERYWREKMAGFTEPTPLTVARRLAAGMEGEGEFADVEAVAQAELTLRLQQLARRHGLTLNTLLQGAWALLLSRYSGKDDVVYGATVSGRPSELSGADEIIGLFINTLPVRVQVPENVSVVQWLRELQAQQVEMRRYEYTPLVDIQSWSDIAPGAPLFESLLVFENIPLEDAVEESKGLDLRNVETESITNFPLVLVVVPGREMSLRLLYDARLFGAETIERMMGHLQTILHGFGERSEGPLASISILTSPERRLLIETWNATASPFDADDFVHERVQRQAERSPRALALAGPTDALSYGELNARANRLAHYLLGQGVGPDSIVAIFMQRSPQTVAAMLAVLKTGAAYLPLDPAYPKERLAFVMEDARARVALTETALVDDLPETDARVVALDGEWPAITLESDENPGVRISPDHVAYVIYTSGSTGRPKGVLIQHRGLNNLIAWHQKEFGVTSADRATHLAGLGFDAAVWEIWPHLTA